MHTKKALLSFLHFLMIYCLNAQHESHIFIKETSGAKITPIQGKQYVQSELLINLSTIFTDKISVELSSIISDQSPSDAVIGIGYKFENQIKIIPAIGLINDPIKPLRIGVFCDYYSEKYTTIGIYKWRPTTSYFYFYELVTKINKLELGIRGERFMLNGFHLGYNMKPYLLFY